MLDGAARAECHSRADADSYRLIFVLMIPLAILLSQGLGRAAQGMMEAVLIALICAGMLQWGLLEKTMARHQT